MKDKETAKVLIEELKNCYNFLRPHVRIGNETPAERININLELGRDRWESIVRKGIVKKER